MSGLFLYRDDIVDNVSFRIQEGSITAILGPNSAGKTTTISMMLGLMNRTSGSIQVFGEDPAHVKVRKQSCSDQSYGIC